LQTFGKNVSNDEQKNYIDFGGKEQFKHTTQLHCSGNVDDFREMTDNKIGCDESQEEFVISIDQHSINTNHNIQQRGNISPLGSKSDDINPHN
jgi:hypothetical protein